MNAPPENDDGPISREDQAIGTEHYTNDKNTPTTSESQSPGAIGMAFYKTLFGDEKPVQRPPIYAAIQLRQDGGPPRILSIHAEPKNVLAYADQMRMAGAAVEAVLITALEPAE